MKTASKVKLPAKWEIHAFPGGKFAHARDLIEHLRPSDKLRKIILHFGMNHREQKPVSYIRDLQQVEETISCIETLGSDEKLEVYAMGVSMPLTLDQTIKDNMKTMNDIIEGTVGKVRYINPLRSLEVAVSPTDPYGIHYTTDTMTKIIDTMSKCLN